MKSFVSFAALLAFALPSMATEVVTADATLPATLHNGSSVVLSNGATLRAEIVSPQTHGAYIAENNRTEVSLVGTASVELGVPDVAYIYVIDNSGSTTHEDGDCGTVLDCMQEFIYALHQEAISDGSASLAAVINFNDTVTVSADLQPISSNNTAIQDAIFAGFGHDENVCQAALNEAARLVDDPRNTARSTVVIFVGDGQCGTCDVGCAIDGRLFAPRHERDCAFGCRGGIGQLRRDDERRVFPTTCGTFPSTVAMCTSVPDPDSLIDIVGQLIGSDLFQVEMQLDGGTYIPVPPSQLTGSALPAEAPAATSFNVTLTLPIGSHEVCVRATGDDSLGGNDLVEDCKVFEVVEAPK